MQTDSAGAPEDSVEIEFDLTQADILALMHFRLRQRRGFRNPVLVRRLLYTGSFFLLALGFWLMFRNSLLAWFFLLLAIISLVLYPMFFKYLIRRKVAATYNDPKNAVLLAPRTLNATNQGLQEKSNLGEMTVNWEAVEHLTSTTTHVFITIQNIPTTVIPRKRVTRGDIQTFSVACLRHINEHTSVSTHTGLSETS